MWPTSDIDNDKDTGPIICFWTSTIIYEAVLFYADLVYRLYLYWYFNHDHNDSCHWELLSAYVS